MNIFKATYDGFRGLPGWAQGVIAVGTGVIGYFAVRGVINRIKSQAQVAKEKESLDQVKKDLKNLTNSGVRKSYPDSQYKQWADSLEKQFAGCDTSSLFSVDVPLIGGYSGSGTKLYNILNQMKNDADMLALVDAYGLRTYDQCGIWSGDFGPATLSQAVADELENDEIDGINAMLASPPKINYRF